METNLILCPIYLSLCRFLSSWDCQQVIPPLNTLLLSYYQILIIPPSLPLVHHSLCLLWIRTLMSIGYGKLLQLLITVSFTLPTLTHWTHLMLIKSPAFLYMTPPPPPISVLEVRIENSNGLRDTQGQEINGGSHCFWQMDFLSAYTVRESR